MQTRRQEILMILKRQGESTVNQLAGMLVLTPVTIRHHLDILRADGLVEASAIRRGRGPGRPRFIYTLTAEAGDCFPQCYDNLANELLDQMQTRLGKQETQDILNAIAARRLQRAPEQDASLSLEKRIERTAAYLTEQGYIASWGKEKGNWFIRICNCLYQNVSSLHPELCSIDLFVLEQLAGEKLERVQSMTDGSHACVYQVARPERDQPPAADFQRRPSSF